MGEIIRIITNKSAWISENNFDMISKEEDVTFSSLKEVTINGKNDGQFFGEYNFTEEHSNEKDFPTAYWSYDFEGKKRVSGDSNHKFRTTLEKTVYFQIDVNDRIPIGTTLQFKLYDYDTGLFMDWVNPDDDEFDGKEVIKTAVVREVDGKKRITIELFLELKWKKEIAEDKGSFRDGCLDFHWKWEYDNTDWNSESVILSVYPSDIRLRIKPALDIKQNGLPEMYSRLGDFLSFAIDQLSDGKIEKFVLIKIRATTTFSSIENINKFKKEIYTESISLKTNTLESASYEVIDVENFFTVRDDIKKIFVEEKVIKVPVAKGSNIAVFNSLKKTINFGKSAAEIFGHIQVLNEMRNMIPELSGNGKFNMPSLSIFIGFIPGAQVLAFGVEVIGWIVADMYKEMEAMVDEQMWITWQNTKTKGLEQAKGFLYTDWATKKRFDKIFIDQTTLNNLLKGKYKKIQELRDESYKLNPAEPNYTIFTYRVIEEEIDDYFDVVDCIFTNN